MTVNASGKTGSFTVAFGADLPALHLLRLKLTDAQGKVLSENTYWRYREANDVQALNALTAAKLSVNTTTSKGKLTAIIRNTGESRTVTVTANTTTSNLKLQVEPYNS